jgi:hypothetical protein
MTQDDPNENDETEDLEDEEEGGEDQAGLNLETPESAAAIAAAMTANVKGKKTVKGKPGTKGRAVDVGLSDKALGLDGDPDSAEGDPESEEDLSALDRDEITDINPEDHIDPLAAMLGANERPWENEELSAAEKRMLAEQGYHRHDPNAEMDEDAPDKGKTVKQAAAIGAVALAAGAMMGRDAAASQSQNSIPPRPPSQNQAQAVRQHDSQWNTSQQTQHVQSVRADTVAAGTPGAGGTRGAHAIETASPSHRNTGPVLAAGVDQHSSRPLRREDLSHVPKKDLHKDSLDILILSQLVTNVDYPQLQRDPDHHLRQNMQVLSMALTLQGAPAPGPDREAAWAEKRALERENARDISALNQQIPGPELDMQRNMQINIGPDMG